MTTAPALLPTRSSPAATIPMVQPSSGPTLGAVVAAASDVAAGIPLGDPRWDVLGPLLTDVVRATRRAAGMPASPIGPNEVVPVVLRLRDLGRLAQRAAANAVFASPEAEAGLRSLQVAAACR